MTFAGQGVDVLDELAALVAQRPELASGVALGTEVLTRVAGSELALSCGAYRHGVDVGAWVMDPDGAPPLSYLRGAAVSYPLSLLAQALLWRALWADALGDAVRAGSIAGFAGHSQGLAMNVGLLHVLTSRWSRSTLVSAVLILPIWAKPAWTRLTGSAE